MLPKLTALSLATLLSLVFASGLTSLDMRVTQTAVGHQAHEECGTTKIMLNTDTAIAYSCTRNLTNITLLRGEISVRALHDPSRSTVVHAGSAEIVDIGTIFTARLHSDGTVVTVVEGSVELAALDSRKRVGSRTVTEGTRAAVVQTPSGLQFRSQPLTSDELSRVLLWENKGLASFGDVPLSVFVTEYNRYHVQKLHVKDPALAAKKFHIATVRMTNFDEVTESLLKLGIEIRQDDDGNLILKSRQALSPPP